MPNAIGPLTLPELLTDWYEIIQAPVRMDSQWNPNPNQSFESYMILDTSSGD